MTRKRYDRKKVRSEERLGYMKVLILFNYHMLFQLVQRRFCDRIFGAIENSSYRKVLFLTF